MFKKMRNAMPKGGGGSGGFRQKVQTLEQMGFSTTLAQNALEATGGNLEQATNLLLSSDHSSSTSRVSSEDGPGSVAVPSAAVGSANASAGSRGGVSSPSEEEQLARAIQESLQTSASSQAQETTTTRSGNGNRNGLHVRSAAAIRAGQAAAARAENASARFGANGKVLRKQAKAKGTENMKVKHAHAPVASSSSSSSYSAVNANANANPNPKPFLAQHPNVKVPKKITDHSKLQQILRTTKRLAPEVLAVDTLLNALMHIRDDPDNDKYRKIDRSSTGYIKALKDKPGAMDLLNAMNFQERTSNPSSDLILTRSNVDHALLYLGISALEEVRQGEEYLNAKRQKEFLKQVRQIQDGSNMNTTSHQEDEIVKRAAFISKCPAEPSGGAGALLQVKIGDETISRRFDGDDILKDVIHWIGGHGSSIPNMIWTREWSLVDLHRYPITEIDAEGDAERTLQYIGCWPSGKLEIRPSTLKWKNEKVPSGEVGSSRGLGAVVPN